MKCTNHQIFVDSSIINIVCPISAYAPSHSVFATINIFSFLILVTPHIKSFELDEAVFAGETVHLDCYVSKGDIPLNITWSFNNKPVTLKMGIKTTKPSARVSTLDIPSALGTNSGNYTCTATNRAGTTNHTATLNVIGIKLNLYSACTACCS